MVVGAGAGVCSGSRNRVGRRGWGRGRSLGVGALQGGGLVRPGGGRHMREVGQVCSWLTQPENKDDGRRNRNIVLTHGAEMWGAFQAAGLA